MQVEVVLLSRNSADTGLRVFNSIEHYGLPITRAAFCGGESPWRYINAFGCQLFLSAEPGDVRKALENQVAAATLVSRQRSGNEDQQLRFAFDGDGDRCGVVDNLGREIFADKMGVLVARDLAAKHPNAKFVADVKSTGLFMTDPVLNELGAETVYWKRVIVT